MACASAGSSVACTAGRPLVSFALPALPEVSWVSGVSWVDFGADLVAVTAVPPPADPSS